MMTNHYLKAKKSALVNCLTCPLCLNLLREATTICVCLHTFCKDCIYQKLEEDETSCCPICNVYLGCLRGDKLRPDNNLQNLRMKIFPLRKSKEAENPPTLTSPTKRKEKSLSSLVTRANPVSTKPRMSRAKAAPRRGGMSRGIMSRVQANREVVEGKNHLNQGDSPECSNMSPLGFKKQRIAGEDERSKVSGNGPDWERLTFLAETADKTDDKNTPLLGFPAFKVGNDGKMNSVLGLPAFKVENDEKKNSSVKTLRRRARQPISSKKRKKSGKIHRINTVGERLNPDSTGAVKVLGSEKQIVALTSENGSSDQSQEISHPIWFALLANKDQNGLTYPQIRKRYIRIKDGSIPVSYIIRYLVEKLDLIDESEVEVMCCGETLVSSTTWSSLFDIWVQHAANTDWLINLHPFYSAATPVPRWWR
ncbi:E3 ubiquitin protein ligase DRIP2-like isoform X2 [Tasmannia lanceolata]|uniref:E3 ubiquitin protein ligase DRIP2-like isoform X2 n=1 Tax=Tasmannia lanceolata TaxID=3420 RepID=UPI0040636755